MSDKAKATGFESNIIESWSGWDGDQELMHFYDATLKRKVGTFEAGSTFDVVLFNLVESKMEIYGAEGTLMGSWKFNLVLEGM